MVKIRRLCIECMSVSDTRRRRGEAEPYRKVGDHDAMLVQRVLHEGTEAVIVLEVFDGGKSTYPAQKRCDQMWRRLSG